jgi:hypothetical protein
VLRPEQTGAGGPKQKTASAEWGLRMREKVRKQMFAFCTPKAVGISFFVLREEEEIRNTHYEIRNKPLSLLPSHQ